MQELLKSYSYYGTGGTCDQLYLPHSIDDAAAAVREIARSGAPSFILGGGTNSLVWDDHFPGSVISLSQMTGIRVHGETIVADGGVENTAVAEAALKFSLKGAAWMNRLPGQLGGTTRMNARCYGGEISQIAAKITCITAKGDVVVRNDPAVFRGYKNTIFMENGDLIVKVELRLSRGTPSEITSIMEFCRTDREAKDQFLFPSCGCVFKNDYSVGVPSGLLLDVAGARHLSRGLAQVSSKHCNFVFNKGASSREILDLTFAMQELVWKEFGIWLHYEMEILGTLPIDLADRVKEFRPNKPNDARLDPLREKFRQKAT